MLGIDYDDLTATLEDEGVKKFADSFASCSRPSKPGATNSPLASR
jgi:hypothetical protein